MANVEVYDATTSSPVADLLFNSKSDTHSWLSNFYVAPFTLDGEEWTSVEHYFQTQKFPYDAAYRSRIRSASTAAYAKRLGSTRTVPIRADWDEVRVDIMRRAISAKFENKDLQRALLDTGNSRLVENSNRDLFWGERQGRGHNKLGELLMELRAKLCTRSETK